MKFLVIQLYQTGDVVLTTHIPRELKKLYPDAQIDFLTFSVNRQLLENSPYITEILTTSKKDGIKGLINTIRQIRKNRYDAVLDLHNNPRSGYCALFSGAKYRVGYGSTSRKFFYNTLPQRLTGSAGEIKLSLIQPFDKNFDMTKYYTKPEIHPAPEYFQKADEVLRGFGISDTDFMVTMSPTHKRATRRWTASHFLDTAKYLTDKHKAKIVITYGPGEEDYIQEHFSDLPENVFLIPPMSMGAFAALIGRAKLHIGNDSAPHHIATAQNVPTFIIIGSTSAGWVYNSPEHTWVSLGMECQPCKKAECKISPDIPCMSGLTFDKIKDKLENFIQHAVKK